MVGARSHRNRADRGSGELLSMATKTRERSMRERGKQRREEKRRGSGHWPGGRGLGDLAAVTRLAGDGELRWRRSGCSWRSQASGRAREAGAPRAQMGFPGPDLGSWRAAAAEAEGEATWRLGSGQGRRMVVAGPIGVRQVSWWRWRVPESKEKVGGDGG